MKKENLKIGKNRKYTILGLISFVSTAVVTITAFVGDGETGGKDLQLAQALNLEQ